MYSNKEQILIVTSEFPPQPGGIGNHAHHLALHLHLNGYKVTVISDCRSKTGLEEAAFDDNLAFQVVRIPVTNPRLFMYLKRLWFLWQQAKQHEVVIASGKFSLWSVGLLWLFQSKKCLAVIHGTEVNLKNAFFKWFTSESLRRFDRVIAVSNFTKQLVSHLPLKHMTVIPNGIDTAKWLDLSAIESVPLKGAPKLITVGRVSERKGQWQVIRHLPTLLTQYPELHYHCLGLANDLDACLQDVQKLGVEDHVTFHGAVSHNRLKALLKASDIFVMLSSESKTGDVEGFGIAILEANALGVPAIGATGSGIEDAILDGKSGILIRGNNTSAFLNAVETILNHKAEFSKQASIWADQHRWEEIIHQYVSVIQR